MECAGSLDSCCNVDAASQLCLLLHALPLWRAAELMYRCQGKPNHSLAACDAHLSVELGGVAAIEGMSEGHHLVQDAAQGPDIGLHKPLLVT